jgi:predicted small lipoprotein YifL
MRNFPLALLIACLLTACGLKGPLTLPGQKPPAAAAPAAPADEKKSSGTVAP